ncbi:response regulator [Cohnella hashimotonis]|uniref:Response regulator n=1 Tax=Cohnella hashimotonis TaxID=2826895 RepID=A0ABT6TSE4_9BACL|nr:response regulator [Cohnella hashimotonis]MDI4649776.1 response regulator [Cohnella hashimotonis]
MVVDDEPAMLTAMRLLLSKTAGVEIAAMLGSAAEAIAYAALYPVDLAFIDIQIAEDDGLALARELRRAHAGLDIVFVTSHKEYALDSFDVYPLDYIVKPVSAKRLAETVARAASVQAQKAYAGHAEAEKEIAAETDRQPSLTIETLRGLRIASNAGGAVKWISRKSRELFAYLLLYRGHAAAKIRTLEDVFPDRELKSSDLYLNTAVYQLRKALSLHGMKDMLVTDRDYYLLQLDRTRVDFIEFEARLSQFRAINGSNEAAAIAVEQLYTGDLFEDLPYEWAIAERERLRDLYEAFAKRLVRYLLDAGRTEQGMQIAKKLVQRNELDEEANLLLFRTLAIMRDNASLQARYKRYEELLDRELGIEPSTEMIDLYRRLV